MIAKPGCGTERVTHICTDHIANSPICGVCPDCRKENFCLVCEERQKVRQQIKDAIEKQIQLLGQPPETNGFKIAALIDVERVLLGEEAKDV